MTDELGAVLEPLVPAEMPVAPAHVQPPGHPRCYLLPWDKIEDALRRVVRLSLGREAEKEQ